VRVVTAAYWTCYLIAAIHVEFGAYILLAQPPIDDAYIASSVFFVIGAAIWLAGYGVKRLPFTAPL
jgi:hypothetical protein